MKTHLFLQAPIQAGKSTLLQEAMEPYREYIGGFVSQRLKDNSLNTLGFRLADYSTRPELTSTFSDELSNIFMKRTTEEKWFKLSVFENQAIEILEKARRSKKIILLDEIGGGELKSDIFKNYLDRLLMGNVPCIGVLKAPKAAANTGRGIGTDLKDENALLHERLDAYNAELLMYSREKFYEQKKYIQRFIEEKLCGHFMTD